MMQSIGKRIALLLILFQGSVFAFSQNAVTNSSVASIPFSNNLAEILKESPSYITDFEILADKNYSLEIILKDSTLQFKLQENLNADSTDYYWLRFKVNNQNPYAEEYGFFVNPVIENTLFYYNQVEQKWLESSAGLAVDNGSRRIGVMPCIIQANAVSTFYVKVKVADLKDFEILAKPSVEIVKMEVLADRDQYMQVLWIATMAVLLAFFLYNAYIYFFFKDKTYLYYLLLIFGGIIYITSLNGYFNVLIPYRIYSVKLVAERALYHCSINSALNQLGIILVLIGFVQFTRAYLKAEQMLPKLDRVMKYVISAFSIYLLIDITFNLFGPVLLNYYTALYVNIAILGIICLILYTGFVSYQNGFKPAKYFLIANAVPLLLMLVLTIYFVLYRFYGNGAVLLPNLAIMIQTLAFAVALVARMQVLKDELHAIQIEVVEQKSKNEKLEEKIAYNNRELASATMYVYQKNQLLADLKKQVEQLNGAAPVKSQSVIKEIRSTIQSNLYLDGDWERFKLHFEQVHPDFFIKLKAEHPTLTQNEVRLCAYFHLNLSVKEIAALINIDPESVRKAKTRLNKKINPTLDPYLSTVRV